MRQEVKIGHTNAHKWIDGNRFIVEKTLNGFNHQLNYKELNTLSFAPQVIANNKHELVTEYIAGKHLNKPTISDLQALATILRELHKSEIKLPKNNIRRRVHEYLKVIHAKGLRPEAVEKSYREMQNIISHMSMLNPLHNDVWEQNIIKTPEGKLFLVDWEYATMGDKHFDLAFYIASARLTVEQEEVFLKQYSAFDDYAAYNPILIPKYKRLVHYLTICWAYAQPQMPFDIKWMEAFLISSK